MLYPFYFKMLILHFEVDWVYNGCSLLLFAYFNRNKNENSIIRRINIR